MAGSGVAGAAGFALTRKSGCEQQTGAVSKNEQNRTA
jgi:hypothetical protein